MTSPAGKINFKLIAVLLAMFESQRDKSERDADKLPGGLAEFPFDFWPGPPSYLAYEWTKAIRGSDEVRLLIDQHLSHMKQLGLIQRAEKAHSPRSWPLGKWRLSNADELGEQMREREDRKAEPPAQGSGGAEPPGAAGQGGGDNGNGGAGAGGAGDDGPGGRGGIRAVLGHPVLFALPQREFEDVVGRLFDGAGAV